MNKKKRLIFFAIFILFFLTGFYTDEILLKYDILKFKNSISRLIEKTKSEKSSKSEEYYCIQKIDKNSKLIWEGKCGFILNEDDFKESGLKFIINDSGEFFLRIKDRKAIILPLKLYSPFRKEIYSYIKKNFFILKNFDFIVLKGKPEHKFFKKKKGTKKYLIKFEDNIFIIINVPEISYKKRVELKIKTILTFSFIFLLLYTLIFTDKIYIQIILYILAMLLSLQLKGSFFVALRSFLFFITIFFVAKTDLKKHILILLILSLSISFLLLYYEDKLNFFLFLTLSFFLILKWEKKKEGLLLIGIVLFYITFMQYESFKKTFEKKELTVRKALTDSFQKIENSSYNNTEAKKIVFTLMQKGLLPPPTVYICKKNELIEYFSYYIPALSGICVFKTKENFFYGSLGGIKGYFIKKKLREREIIFFIRETDIERWLKNYGISEILIVSSGSNSKGSIYFGPLRIKIKNSDLDFLDYLHNITLFFVIPFFISFLLSKLTYEKSSGIKKLKFKYMLFSVVFPFFVISFVFLGAEFTLKDTINKKNEAFFSKLSFFYINTFRTFESKNLSYDKIAFEMYSSGIYKIALYNEGRLSFMLYYPEKFIPAIIPFNVLKNIKRKGYFILKEKDIFNLYISSKDKKNIIFIKSPISLNSSKEQNTLLFLLLFYTYSLSTVLIIFYFDKISKKMAILDEGLKKLSKGELKKIEYHRKDDFREVFNIFNNMVERFKRVKERLKELAEKEVALAVSRKTAHEIKNPLTPIKLNLNYLINLKKQDKEKFLKEFDELIPSILTELKKIEDVSRDLLLFSKDKNIKLKKIEIENIVKKTIELFKGYNVEFSIKVDKSNVLGDENFIEIILKNLIINSIEAMKEDKKIEIKGISKKDFYEIRVRDYGSGIPDTEIKKIFKTGFSKKGGSGLGLSIVRDLVKRIGGRIDVVSWEGKGTLFIIELLKAEENDE